MEKQFVFKAHPSAIGALMSNGKGTVFTQKDAEQLTEYEQRKKGTFLSKSGKPLPLTDEMEKKRVDLIAKRDKKPELGDTAKSIVEAQLLYDVFGIPNDFSSKQTDKGNKCEQSSIELLQKVAGLFGIEKNETTFENEYLIGTPDVIGPDNVIDVKTPWSSKTFPWFKKTLPTNSYEWQLQGYFMLTGKKVGYIAYCLTNATEDIIQDEIRRTAWNEKLIDATDEQLDEIEHRVRWRMEFDQVPDALRVKLYQIEYDENKQQQIIERVELCREYYNEKLAELFDKMDEAPIIPNF